jgi:hypothetical protein
LEDTNEGFGGGYILVCEDRNEGFEDRNKGFEDTNEGFEDTNVGWNLRCY